ncbi:IclR family transcriptional regulator, partial [Pseudomonas aeruginosa]|nr:IclR family transcriptional regulator [Pseudomonas aeruginosa]
MFCAAGLHAAGRSLVSSRRLAAGNSVPHTWKARAGCCGEGGMSGS